MITYENDCVYCEWCANCGRDHTPHFYCDACGLEIEEDPIYRYEGDDLCKHCLGEALGIDLDDYANYEVEDLLDVYDFEIIKRGDYE